MVMATIVERESIAVAVCPNNKPNLTICLHRNSQKNNLNEKSITYNSFDENPFTEINMFVC